MPRVAGVNLVAVLAGAVAMYFVGFLLYGFIFQQVWAQQTLENHGLVAPGNGASLTGAALTEALMKIPGALDFGPAMGFGFVISLVTALGIALVLGMTKAASLGAALRVGFVLWLGFAATTLGYNVVYSAESRIIYAIDLVHLLIGYLLGATVIYLLDGKAIKA